MRSNMGLETIYDPYSGDISAPNNKKAVFHKRGGSLPRSQARELQNAKFYPKTFGRS